MNKRRGRIEVIRDILAAIRESGDRAKPTHVMYKANLSHQMLSEYMKTLAENEFIRKTSGPPRRRYITLSEKGHRFLERYGAVRDMIDSFSSE